MNQLPWLLVVMMSVCEAKQRAETTFFKRRLFLLAVGAEEEQRARETDH